MSIMRKNRFIQAKNIGKKTLLFCLLTLLSLATFATPTKDAADEAYKRGHYQQAIADYDSLIKVQPTAELYYNLGNAHFRTDNITQAILAYERALLLKPGDNDIRFNLEFARGKTIDKITPESEMFFFTWYRSLIRLTSVDGWARFAVVSIALALLLLLLYLFATRVWLRQVGFFGAILFLALFLVSNLFAYQQKQQNLAQSGAVIVAPSVSVKKTPDTAGTESFLLHEGTRVTITDRSIANWIAVRLDDGREGWMLTNSVEEI